MQQPHRKQWNVSYSEEKHFSSAGLILCFCMSPCYAQASSEGCLFLLGVTDAAVLSALRGGWLGGGTEHILMQRHNRLPPLRMLTCRLARDFIYSINLFN